MSARPSAGRDSGHSARGDPTGFCGWHGRAFHLDCSPATGGGSSGDRTKDGRLTGQGRASALRCHDREIERGPGNPDALRAKARTLARMERVTEALPLYRRLVARGSANPELVAERAEALAAAGRRVEAGFAYDAALALTPDDTTLQQKRALLVEPRPSGA